MVERPTYPPDPKIVQQFLADNPSVLTVWEGARGPIGRIIGEEVPTDWPLGEALVWTDERLRHASIRLEICEPSLVPLAQACQEYVRSFLGRLRELEGAEHQVKAHLFETKEVLVSLKKIEALVEDLWRVRKAGAGVSAPKAVTKRAATAVELQGEPIGAAPQEELLQWAGGAPLSTPAIVFTDIVGSTALCMDLGGAEWALILLKHYDRAERLVRERKGFLVKKMGDGIFALFHNPVEAVDFAVRLHQDTGHASIRLRAGVHVGLVSIEADISGQDLHLTSRIMRSAEAGGVVISDLVKKYIDQRRDRRTEQLHWTARPNVVLKDFPEPMTLWQVVG